MQKVILGDCLSVLKEFNNETFDLIIADPPYNIGLNYDGYNDNLPYDKYVKWSSQWIKECCRVLKKNGSIFVVMGDEYVAEINIILKKQNLYFRNWIIWYYTFGQNQRKKFNRSHTHILYYVKDKNNFTFNGDDVRVPSKRQLIYKDKRANPKGKIPDDVWEIPRVCGTFKERVKGHPCQMPEKLIERIVKVASNEGDYVLDPFGGTGTTASVCKKLNRNFVVIEKSEKYYDEIIKRISQNTINAMI